MERSAQTREEERKRERESESARARMKRGRAGRSEKSVRACVRVCARARALVYDSGKTHPAGDIGNFLHDLLESCRLLGLLLVQQSDLLAKFPGIRHDDDRCCRRCSCWCSVAHAAAKACQRAPAATVDTPAPAPQPWAENLRQS
jgi:hypothetical protein